MVRRFSINYIILSILMDGIFVVLSLMSSTFLRPYFNQIWFVKEIAQPIELQPGIYIICLAVWIGILFYSSVYDVAKNVQFFQEFTNLFFASTLASLTLAGILYLTYRDVSRLLFILFIIQVALASFIWRLIPWLLIKLGVNKENSRAVLVVGAGEIGQEIRERIIENPQFNRIFAGYIDDDQTKDVIAGIKEIREVVVKNEIQDVFITLPRIESKRVDDIVQKLHDLPVTIWVIPDYFSLILQRAEVGEFAGIPMLNLRAPALKDHQILGKRIFDLIMGVLLLPFILGLMLIIGIVLKFEGKGPILFVQNRVGQNGRQFKMYKFRTMVVGADKKQPARTNLDEVELLQHKLPGDPRITKVGRFLRKSSLDEIPQLINVFLGNMSFVGPRPELPWVVAEYEQWQHKRFSIPPGITGWWQIMGRSDRPMHLHTEDDLYYIKNYSILLDIKILLITVWKVISGEGAY